MTADDLTELREFGRELGMEIAGPSAGLRDRVLAGLSEQRQSAGWPAGMRWRRPRRAGRGVALAAALAVGLAAVILAIPILGGRNAPGGASAQAAAVLNRAALAAMRQRPLTAAPSQYLYIKSVENAATFNPPSSKAVWTVSLYETWLSVSGVRNGLLRERPLASTAPGKPTGRWRSTVLPGCHHGRSPDGGRMVTVKGKKVVALGVNGPCTPQPAVLTGLPVTTGGMIAYLYHHLAGQNPPDEQAFITAGDMIRGQYLTPRALAALFRAVAQIPGVTVVHNAVTADARRGIAVQRIYKGISEQLIFDPVTFAFIGEREVAVSTASGLRPGTVTDSLAVLQAAIVSHAGEHP